jgi:micrococcal nuclease
MLTRVNKWISRTTQCLAYYVCLCYSPPRNMNSIDKDVQDANWKNTRPFVPNIKACKVIKVYDGDTITVATKLHETFPVHRFSVRLSGIDTPELRTSNENEKKRAYIAKKYLEDKILNQTVVLDNIATEKYGRLLATVYYNGVDINKEMIENTYAVSYTGGKKTTPPEWLEDLEE